MDQQNIDRLFREKLDGLEVTPNPDSWSKVEKQIGSKKTPVLYWVAASVSLLFISWLVWPEQSFSLGEALADFDHPVMNKSTDMTAPIAAQLNEIKPQTIIPRKVTPNIQEPVVQLVADNDSNQKPVIDELQEVIEEVNHESAVAINEETIEPIETTVIAEEASRPLLEEEPKIDYSAVKITYIASATKVQPEQKVAKNDSTGVLKKFIAFAGKLDPGEMLADMKTAKDNLLNGGLKNKKERSSMNP